MQQQQGGWDPVARMQQMAGSSDFQPPAQQGGTGKPQQVGEGSYEGTREYKERTERYLEKDTVQSDAEKAKPKSEQEAREMEQAEDEGRSHSKGED